MARQRMTYREQKFVYGEFMEVSTYPVFWTEASTGKRTKRKPTSIVQQNLNKANAADEINRIICANFTRRDYYLTITYANDPGSEERVKKDIENFLMRLKRAMRKKGLPVPKWVKCVEQGSRGGRWHAHFVISGGLAPHEIAELWGKGYIDCKPLIFRADGCRGIGGYFVKEHKNKPGDQHKAKCWSCSCNCVRTQPKTNDYRFSKKRAAELAKDRENARVIEKLYPDYICNECRAFYNDSSGLFYLRMYFYRKDAKLSP